jgi:HSP20 family molecular chaperone IbpA
MTTRTILFDSPFLLGFEHTRALVEQAQKAASEGYPPYNVQALAQGGVRITLAVAGFSSDQLSVLVEDRQLVISGRRDPEEEASRAFLHRGIAARAFSRTFVLADGMEVTGAVLEHGLLHVDVARPEPERTRTSVPIRTIG